MTITETAGRLLLGAGPTNPYPEVVEALATPMIGVTDPAQIDLQQRITERLRVAFVTTNVLTLAVPGPGSAGMEVAFANLVEPGVPVVIGVNGWFGERLCLVAEAYGAAVIRVRSPWGRSLDVDALLSAHPSPAIIALTHAETSTGVENDVRAVAAAKGDALVVADCVTSFGGQELRVDDWGIDVAFSGSQKCVGAPPGLAPVTLSPRAVERFVPNPHTWMYDLAPIARALGDDERAHRYGFTPPLTMLAALDAALGVMLAEGVEQVWARHAEAGRVLQDGLQARGARLLAEPSHRLAQITTFAVPDDLDPIEDRARLRTEFGIEISPGIAEWGATAWRVGLLGPNATVATAERFLTAFDQLRRTR